VLRNAIQTNPRSPALYFMLAMTFLQREERYPESVEFAHLALEQGPKGRELQLNYLGDSEREHGFAQLARGVSAGGGQDQ
jgi:hypothetical protein